MTRCCWKLPHILRVLRHPTICIRQVAILSLQGICCSGTRVEVQLVIKEHEKYSCALLVTHRCTFQTYCRHSG